MKTLANFTGYFAACLLMITVVFKMNNLPGANAAMIIAGIFLSIYFPVFIINKLADSGRGRSLPVHYVLAVAVSLVNLAIVFRIQHWVGAGRLFVSGFTAFSCIYLPVMLFQLLEQKNPGRLKAAYITGTLGAFTLAQGFVFKIMRWPAGQELMIAGVALLFAGAFPLYLSETSRNTDDKYIRLRDLLFAIIMGSMLIIFFLRNELAQDPQTSFLYPLSVFLLRV